MNRSRTVLQTNGGQAQRKCFTSIKDDKHEITFIFRVRLTASKSCGHCDGAGGQLRHSRQRGTAPSHTSRLGYDKHT